MIRYLGAGGVLARSQSLFCLAWFHAVCQERRNYIPQVKATNTNMDQSSVSKTVSLPTQLHFQAANLNYHHKALQSCNSHRCKTNNNYFLLLIFLLLEWKSYIQYSKCYLHLLLSHVNTHLLYHSIIL